MATKKKKASKRTRSGHALTASTHGRGTPPGVKRARKAKKAAKKKK